MYIGKTDKGKINFLGILNNKTNYIQVVYLLNND